MPFDFNEDLMPRNVPKPAPLIEVAATPLVPEVSLLLDQDRNRSVHLNTLPNINRAEDKSKLPPKERERQVSYGNGFGSYNTWKATNAHLLSAVTGSSVIPDKMVTQNSTLEKCNGVQKAHSSDKENIYAETLFTRKVPRANHTSRAELECLGDNNQQSHQQPVRTIDEPHTNNVPSMPVCYTQTVNNQQLTGNREMMYVHMPPQSQYPNLPTSHNQVKPCFLFPSNGHSTIDKEQYPHTHVNTQVDSKKHQSFGLCSYSQREPGFNTINQGHCQCAKAGCERATNGGVQYVDPKPCVPNGGITRNVPSTYSKLVSPLDIAHVNNQVVIDLYHIINLQNEQISMLQQQVKQVLQIHMDCNKSDKRHSNSCSCHKNCKCCDHSTRCGSEKGSCSSAHRENGIANKADKFSNNKNESYEVSRRSIGVMTSSVDKTEDSSVALQTEKHSSVQSRSKKRRDNKPNPPPSSGFRSQPTRTDSNNGEGRRKKSTSKTEMKPKPVESTHVDNSFSLNEAELVIRSEQDDVSPNSSVHVDLQDYCSSSLDSDSDATGSSSSVDEVERNSESGDDSTDPQIGWTFYNRVVGQVNNILKKTPTPPRQAPPHVYRTPAGHMYGLNTDFETENNWSKRVTFDGPPKEGSGNTSPNLREIPKFDHNMPHQDMRLKDGHGRMQDFMMYNFANGNTNLSFATLRYLDQYHMLPYQGKSKPVEQMYQPQAYQRSKKYMKKKSRNFEKNPDLPHHMNKRKSNTPSSKLLDITALKQQPKLF